MTPTATLERPTATDSTETSDSVITAPLEVTRETTIRQIMNEAQVSPKEAENFLDQILAITQSMQQYRRQSRHFSKTEIGELHAILKAVMPAHVSNPGEGTAHWMVNRLAFPREPGIGLMHSSSREGPLTFCDAKIVTIGT